MDNIGNMFAQIRNGAMARKISVDVPYSKIKEGIVKILLAKEFILGYEAIKRLERQYLRIKLKYKAKKKSHITNLQRISTPGRRVYVNTDEIPQPLSGFGVAILSTNKGIITDEEARSLRVGGEVLCYIW